MSENNDPAGGRQEEKKAVVGPEPSPITSEERRAKLEEELEKIPLFMTQLPEIEDDNPAVEALKSMVSDEPPEEMAKTLKEEGNLCFKRGKYADAAGYYSNGLDYDHDNKDLRLALLINRAAANLELQNYGMVLRDCSDALRIKPKTPKALYRATKACIALEKFDEADECCKWGLGLDPGNKDLLRVQKEAAGAREVHDRKAREREERERIKAEKRDRLRKAIEIRSKLTFDTPGDGAKRTSVHPWENESGRQVTLDENTGHLLWPVFFLYPESKESDFVERFDEALTLRDMLREVLAEPPYWDDRQHPKYTIDNVDTYFLHHPVGGFDQDERLVKVGMDTFLATALDNEKFVIRDGIPSFIVLPRGDTFTDQFIDRYRKLRQAQAAAKKSVNP
ncbi:HSP70/90 co-chaperone [Coemansia sp. RSA 1813]|nr:HSP70/90 co-chaperone [Coemansia sp. RSA 1646]KAJ1774061.1 HSP70/90 co-chaperone [Coemansia sp. RSA 1843]KAJ2092548.1 HSP70/90 co-chaperone [Coemansia sp. RSA 986]KAJ2216757.1 HSP70/90 co-chaperone [Coemansia sp. RSA 487]KAJ2572829.1 HSP70/90 co-chaperone [Coemansia sp. RSA 1813]